MTWFKLDDQFHSHPKVLTAGNAAVGLYCRLGTWIADKLTDGFIPAGVARSMGSPRELKALLTPPAPGMGALLVVVDGGYQMPDYLEYNPTREKVLAEREAAKKRMQRVRGSGEVRANEQENFAGSSHSPDPVPPAGVLRDSPPPSHGSAAGGDPVDKRRQAIVALYARMALDKAKGSGAVIGSDQAYMNKASKTARTHVDLERYASEFPEAPPDAVAAWLHGDKHSMAYYEHVPAGTPDAAVIPIDRHTA
jgi:hypothetical protein